MKDAEDFWERHKNLVEWHKETKAHLVQIKWMLAIITGLLIGNTPWKEWF